jgi:hypothetical protein
LAGFFYFWRFSALLQPRHWKTHDLSYTSKTNGFHHKDETHFMTRVHHTFPKKRKSGFNQYEDRRAA